MSEKGAIKKSTAQAICDAVKVKEGTTEGVPFKDVAERILALPTASGENKFNQLVNKTITEVTAKDLEGVTEIPKAIFQYCRNLISVDVPSSVTKINNDAFYSCESLISANIPSNVTIISDYAFYQCKKLSPIDIPPSVKTLGMYAFAYCIAITNLVIPDSVTSVNIRAFEGCSSLQSAIVGSGVKHIPAYIFYGCSNLTSVTFLYDAITKIEEYAFYNCTALTNYTVPSSVTSIGSKALEIGTTDNKATITFLGTTPPTIKYNTFNAQKLEKIIVPAGCGDAYKSATNWANFADYIEEATE